MYLDLFNCIVALLEDPVAVLGTAGSCCGQLLLLDIQLRQLTCALEHRVAVRLTLKYIQRLID